MLKKLLSFKKSTMHILYIGGKKTIFRSLLARKKQHDFDALFFSTLHAKNTCLYTHTLDQW